jgi:uncharacterized membrane-anchored protein
MTLTQALLNQGNDAQEVRDILADMMDRVLEQQEDPEEVLADYGLEPDYVMDLIGIGF